MMSTSVAISAAIFPSAMSRAVGLGHVGRENERDLFLGEASTTAAGGLARNGVIFREPRAEGSGKVATSAYRLTRPNSRSG